MPETPSAPLPPPSTGSTTPTSDPLAPSPPARIQVPFRVGDLTVGWRIVLVAAWVGAFLAYLAVWKASEEMGIHTWWLGPRADPQPIAIRLAPFIVCALFGIMASSQLRGLSWISLGGSAVLAALAVPDISIAVGVAVVEFAIAAAVALVSFASLTGRYRAAEAGEHR